MPFSHRVFCCDFASPNLSEVLVWLRQHEYSVSLSGGRSTNDLLSSFWTEVALSLGESESPLVLRCVRADQHGAEQLRAEIADFTADVLELPDTEARARVLSHLAATRAMIVIEFSPEGPSPRAEDTAESIAALFIERAFGLGQRDGVGFVDEDDEVVLAIG